MAEEQLRGPVPGHDQAAVVGEDNRVGSRLHDGTELFFGFAQLAFDVLRPVREMVDLHRATQDGREFFCVVGPGQAGEGVSQEDPDLMLDRRVPSEHNNRELGVQLLYGLQEGQSIRIRQLNIQQRGPVPFLLDLLNHFRAVTHGGDPVSFLGQQVSQRIADVPVIVYD